MSPFIRRVKTASGAVAVQIMEKQGRRNVLVRHVGSAHSEAELAVLMQAAQDELHPGQLSFDFAPADRVATGALRVGAKRSALLWHVLERAYADLGFDVLEDEAFKQMVRLVSLSRVRRKQLLACLNVSALSISVAGRCLMPCSGACSVLTGTGSLLLVLLTLLGVGICLWCCMT